MLKANIETFLACDASYEEAGIVLYGAPFDSTTSYRPGTGSAHGRSARNPMGWNRIRRTRIVI